MFVGTSEQRDKQKSRISLPQDPAPLTHATVEALFAYLHTEPQEPFLLPEKSLTDGRQYRHQVTIPNGNQNAGFNF